MAVAVAQGLYTGEPLDSDLQEVRFLIGDIDSNDLLLGDKEIEAALSLAGGQQGGTASTSTLAVAGTTAAGATSIDLDATSVSGTIELGDSFTVAGDIQRYSVTNVTTASDNLFTDVEFWPGLVTSAANDAVVTLRHASVYEAAALCCESLARRFAREVDVTVSSGTGSKTTNHSQKSKAYRELARELRQAGSSTRGAFGVRLVRV